MVCCSTRHCFDPLRHIVNSHENVSISEGSRKWFHEVDASNVKLLNNQNRVKWHHMTTRDFSQPLAFVSLFAHGIGIFKQRRPIKTCLQHLHYCFLGSKMTSTGLVMAVAEYPFLFSFWHTISDYLISTIFEQIWFFPIVGVDFCMEELLVLCFPLCWQLPCYQKVSNVGKPRSIVHSK